MSKIEEFTAQLATSGLPVAYDHFPLEEPQNAPFVCWLSPGEDPLLADGGVYYSAWETVVELYTDRRDPELEVQFERTALANCSYTKTCKSLPSEGLHMTAYNLQI